MDFDNPVTKYEKSSLIFRRAVFDKTMGDLGGGLGDAL